MKPLQVVDLHSPGQTACLFGKPPQSLAWQALARFLQGLSTKLSTGNLDIFQKCRQIKDLGSILPAGGQKALRSQHHNPVPQVP
ncbi:MAG: hypothetical protein KA752_05370 [Giesbergeria sp.]|nr:hypothetical protein [Giesbergeria sp.]